MSLLKLLANGNFITVNKCVAKSIGLNESVILGALCSEFVYCEGKGNVEGGFFPFSVDALQEETTLGEKPQKTAINNLINYGVIEQKNFGVPQKRHFRINEDSLQKLLLGDSKTAQMAELEPPEWTKYNSKKEICNNNNKVNIVEHPYEEIIGRLNERTGSHYKSTTSKTRGFINARFSEGFSFDDFKVVIDKKCDEWMGTEMQKYLRPETLFGNKFESYLNQKVISKKPGFKNFDERDRDWDDIESKLFNR